MMNQIKFTLILCLVGSLAQAQKAVSRASSAPATKAFASAKTFTVAKHSVQYVKPDLSLGRARQSKPMNYALNEISVGAPLVSTMSADASEKPRTSAFGLIAQIGYTSALYDQQDGQREKSYDFLLASSYKMNANYSVSAVLTGSADANNRDGSDFGKGQLTLSKTPWSWKMDENFLKAWDFKPSLSLSLPVSKDARDNQSLIVGVRPGISISPNASLLGTEKLKLALEITAARNIHTYETARSGKSNAQYGSAQTLKLGYTVLKKISLELAANHYNSWTYQGTANELWGHSQELSASLSEKLAWAVGHQYGNPAVNIYRADGSSLNLGLINEQFSYYYTNLTATF